MMYWRVASRMTDEVVLGGGWLIDHSRVPHASVFEVCGF